MDGDSGRQSFAVLALAALAITACVSAGDRAAAPGGIERTAPTASQTASGEATGDTSTATGTLTAGGTASDAATAGMPPPAGRTAGPAASGEGGGSALPAGTDIVATTRAAGSFATFTRVLEAAGLVEALRAPGPYTVFAPTDGAFAKLPAGTLEELLRPENRERLRDLLTYHVVLGRIAARDIGSESRAPTLQGQAVRLESANGAVTVDGATVLRADLAASNGLIHVIDSVIMPKQAVAEAP